MYAILEEILENVEHCGVDLSKLIQPVSWQTETGVPGEGMSVECGYICMN